MSGDIKNWRFLAPNSALSTYKMNTCTPQEAWDRLSSYRQQSVRSLMEQGWALRDAATLTETNDLPQSSFRVERSESGRLPPKDQAGVSVPALEAALSKVLESYGFQRTPKLDHHTLDVVVKVLLDRAGHAQDLLIHQRAMAAIGRPVMGSTYPERVAAFKEAADLVQSLKPQERLP